MVIISLFVNYSSWTDRKKTQDLVLSDALDFLCGSCNISPMDEPGLQHSNDSSHSEDSRLSEGTAVAKALRLEWLTCLRNRETLEMGK